MSSNLNIYNIPIDFPFLQTLAAAVLNGFPCEDDGRPRPDQLCRWTILLPTRRACGELERCLYKMSGAGALLLPRIRAIGDADEDFLGNSPMIPAIPEAISPMARDFALVAMVEDWSEAHPQSLLAQRIATTPMQAHALAVSLGQLIDEFETEEVDLARLPALYDVELAAHREAILDLLSLVKTKYPEFLLKTGQIGQRRRRSLLLRYEAEMLAECPPSGPLIAAGSTGSIPATRALLKAIAALPNGAVILPGLDQQLDEKSWDAAGPQHPQFILKQLLGELKISRQEIRLTQGTEFGNRSRLAAELMRPTETTENWLETINAGRNSIHEAMNGIELVELPNSQDESVAIALMFRKFWEQSGLSVSLVTPDRILARRVRSELRRWNLDAADSAGDSLISFSGPALMGLLAEAIIGGFAPALVKALFHHDLCRFELTAEDARRAAAVIDIVMSSEGRLTKGIGALDQAVEQMQSRSLSDPHAHPALKQIAEKDWIAARVFAQRASSALGQFSPWKVSALSEQFGTILSMAERIAGPALWDGDEGQVLASLRDQLPLEAKLAAPRRLAYAAAILLHQLRSLAVFSPGWRQSRFSILGLLEARLLAPDVVILGGLNEGTWPHQPDTGPWLNRPMRGALNMEQPERGIGQMAHDFVQCLGNSQVYLVWSRRDAGDPKIPSRWILRLQMLLKSTGMHDKMGSETSWHKLASVLDSAGVVEPHDRPRPRPPASARPRAISVTQVETLIRDPYAFYARAILKIQPLAAISANMNLALRGKLIHLAIGDFLRLYPCALPDNPLDELIRCGQRHFAPLLEDPDVAGFWWPDFLRMARWIATEEITRRTGVESTIAETGGALEFSLDHGSHMLVCRADRIDLMRDGSASIMDYKTGSVPSDSDVISGHAPQLTLQAHILSKGGFTGVSARSVSAVQYAKLKGGESPGISRTVKLKESIGDCSLRHFDGLKRLLSSYASEDQPYFPRVAIWQEDSELEYDHLSRYREWILSGTMS